MKITHNTTLVIKDGKLQYLENDEYELATPETILKHYQALQHFAVLNTGAYATDDPQALIPLIGQDVFDRLFWEVKV